MRLTHVITILALIPLFSGCASSRLDDEFVGPPTTVAQAEREMEQHAKYDFEASKYDFGQEWSEFKRKLQPGDELRAYDHPRGGRGWQIYRNGQVVETYFWLIY